MASAARAETGGDEEIKRDVLDFVSRRWSEAMQRYMASLYELDVDTWRAVVDFIERAAGSCAARLGRLAEATIP